MLSTPKCTRKPPSTKGYPAQKTNSAASERPWQRSCYQLSLNGHSIYDHQHYRETLLGLMKIQNSISPSFSLCSIWWLIAVPVSSEEAGHWDQNQEKSLPIRGTASGSCNSQNQILLNLDEDNQERVERKITESQGISLRIIVRLGKDHRVQNERVVKDTQGRAYPSHISHLSADSH